MASISFDRYSHVEDLFKYYAQRDGRGEVVKLFESGICDEAAAEVFCKFAWQVAGFINEDEENGVTVLGSTDNTDMIPDISYELTTLMKKLGYYAVWERVSREELN